MKEKTLLKIAFVCGIIGLFFLFIISDNIEINEKTIDKINKDNVGEDVKLVGTVSRLTNLEDVAFIELEQPSKITIVLFKDKKKNISLYQGDTVEIIGEIDEYDGKLEVIAQRIRVLE
jgi:aspartyl/asparaginyl-tRNA synthetase